MRKKTKVTTALVIVILVLIVWLVMRQSGAQQHEPAAEHGEALAKKYCASCHLYPEPQLLDKKTWREGVLPNMAMRLGIRMPGQDPFKDMDTTDAVWCMR